STGVPVPAGGRGPRVQVGRALHWPRNQAGERYTSHQVQENLGGGSLSPDPGGPVGGGLSHPGQEKVIRAWREAPRTVTAVATAALRYARSGSRGRRAPGRG